MLLHSMYNVFLSTLFTVSAPFIRRMTIFFSHGFSADGAIIESALPPPFFCFFSLLALPLPPLNGDSSEKTSERGQKERVESKQKQRWVEANDNLFQIALQSLDSSMFENVVAT